MERFIREHKVVILWHRSKGPDVIILGNLSFSGIYYWKCVEVTHFYVLIKNLIWKMLLIW